jgi:hypothetical protein
MCNRGDQPSGGGEVLNSVHFIAHSVKLYFNDQTFGLVSPAGHLLS